MIYWLWLHCALGAGGNKSDEILSHFSSAKALFEAGEEGRRASGIFTDSQLTKLKNTSLDQAQKLLKQCELEKISIITIGDKAYPYCLRNISKPPYVLFYKGALPDFDSTPTLCVIGTRKVTDYGYKCAYSLSGRLSRGGFLIVSGGALGSDTAAHLGALLTGGKTVAVLPCGFNSNYLAANKKLRSDILSTGGCLITEFSPEEDVRKSNFYTRNRLMSALSSGVIVTEAPIKSGALITAAHAAEQNKDIFVILGKPDDVNYEGCYSLYRDGAKAVSLITDVFSEYVYRFNDKISIEMAMAKPLPSYKSYNNEEEKRDNEIIKRVKKTPYKLKEQPINKVQISEKNEINKKILPETLSKNTKMIYNQLDKQIFSCDDLLSSEVNSSMALAAVGELELYGLIEAIPGGRYKLL